MGYLTGSFSKLYTKVQKTNILRKGKVAFFYLDRCLLFFSKKPSEKNSQKKQILIIYNLAFGDGVIFRCAATELRKLYPKDQYEITLACQKGMENIYKEDDFCDKILPLDFNRGTCHLKDRWKNIQLLRSQVYDIILDPIGTEEWMTNVLMTRVTVSKEKIGLKDQTISSLCSNRKLKKIYTRLISVERPHQSLLELYETFVQGLDQKMEQFQIGLKSLKDQKPDLKLPSQYFIIFPSAGGSFKKWPIDRYAYLAKKIYQKTKYTLLLCGTDLDREAVLELEGKLDPSIPYLDIVGKTSLREYLYIIRKANLVITNDTSAYHIAIMDQTPVAIITGGYDYDKYVSYHFKRQNEFRKPCIIVHSLPCFNCDHHCKLLTSHDAIWPCLNQITEEEAWNQLNPWIDTLMKEKKHEVGKVRTNQR